MTKKVMNPKVDFYFDKAKNWKAEMEQLRMTMLDCGLTEELKWGKPCYTSDKSIIVVIQGFKAYCALLFYKGYLLKDPNNILIKTGENTRVGRQIRFADVKEVIKMEPVLKAYIQEAVEIEKAGIKTDIKKDTNLELPEEFEKQLAENPALKTAFIALTPGRQRAYNIYFSAPKQSKTREARIGKAIQQILDGKGLND